jgi:hypothetical protein
MGQNTRTLYKNTHDLQPHLHSQRRAHAQATDNHPSRPLPINILSPHLFLLSDNLLHGTTKSAQSTASSTPTTHLNLHPPRNLNIRHQALNALLKIQTPRLSTKIPLQANLIQRADSIAIERDMREEVLHVPRGEGIEEEVVMLEPGVEPGLDVIFGGAWRRDAVEEAVVGGGGFGGGISCGQAVGGGMHCDDGKGFRSILSEAEEL